MMWKKDGEELTISEREELMEKEKDALCPKCRLNMTFEFYGDSYIHYKKWHCPNGCHFEYVSD